MNANETESYVDYDAIAGKGNVQKVSYKNYLKVTDHGSMEVVSEIAVGNSMNFESVKIPSTPDYYVPSEVNIIKGALAL